MPNWNHGNDLTGRFRGGKTAAERSDRAARQQRQEARAEYTKWCSSSASQAATTALAIAKFPWGVCNGKRTRALRNKVKRALSTNEGGR